MRTPRRDILIQSLFESMSALKRGMAGQWHLMNQGCPISRSQLELLFTIRHAQPVSFKHLAQQLYLTPGAISQLAEGLEQHELISRQSDDRDRRIQCLRVTRKGNKLLDNIEKHRQKVMEHVMEDLSDEELALWLQVQEKLLKHFQTEAAEHHKKEIV